MENIAKSKKYSRTYQQPPNQSKYSPRQQQLSSCSQREALLSYGQSFLTKSENAESKSSDARVSVQPIPHNLISSRYSVLDEANMTLVQNQALATYLESAYPSPCKDWLEIYGHSCCAILSDTNTPLGTGYLIAPDVILTSKHILMPLLRSEVPLQSISVCFDDNPHSDRKIPFLYALEDGAQGDSKFDYVIVRLSKSVEMTPIPLLTEQPLGTSVVLHYPHGQEKQVSMGTFAGVSEYYEFESIYSSLTHHSSSGSPLGRASDGIIGWHTAYVKDGLRRGELFGSVKLNKPDSLLAKLLTNPWLLTAPRNLPQEAVNKTLSEAPSVDLSLELPQIREQEILEGQRLSLGDIRKIFNEKMESQRFFKTNYLTVGECIKSKATPSNPDLSSKSEDYKTVPVIIEVMEYQVESAKNKIKKLSESRRLERNPVAMVIGFNKKIESNSTQDELAKLLKVCRDISSYMTELQVPGVCFPFLWSPTEPPKQDGKNEGYVFPFLEARSMLTLHPQINLLHEELEKLGPFVIRGMDGDISQDHFLNNSLGDKETDFQKILKHLVDGKLSLLSGGYRWDVRDVEKRVNSLGLANPITDSDVIGKLKSLLKKYNDYELNVRYEISRTFGYKAIYWPEPNVYASKNTRLQGALNAYNQATQICGKSQQKESTHMVRSTEGNGVFVPLLATRKPIKEYLDPFLKHFTPILKGTSDFDFKSTKDIITSTQQSHFKVSRIIDNLKWHGATTIDKDKIKQVIKPYLKKLLIELNIICLSEKG